MTKKERFLPNHILKNFSVVGLWTLLSRILGFIRDVLIATFLGSGPVAEAFILAFTLPNMFRRLFAEGAFNTAFIPILSKKIKTKNNPERFASEAVSILVTSLLILTAIAEIFMPFLVFCTASGFSSDTRFDLSVKFGRVMFPYIFLISLSAFLGGILNAYNRYSAAAAAPLLLNLFFIFSLIIAFIFNLNFGWALTICVPLAGASQLILLIVFIKRERFKLHIKLPKLTPEILNLIKIAVPAALAGGVLQINLVVGRQVASHFEGAIAWLNYADRIYQLPLGVVGIAIGIVLLPNLSKSSSKILSKENNSIVNRSTEFALILTLPATCALLIIPYPVISTLFERGAFTTIDSINTSNALLIYAIGLPAFIFQKILSTIYFSSSDTKSPFRYALIGMLTNLFLAVGLSGILGYLAPAVGTTVSSWLIAFLLWRNSGNLGFYFDQKFKKIVMKILFACFILSIFLFTTRYFLFDILTGITTKPITLIIVLTISSLIYFLTCSFLDLKKSFINSKTTEYDNSF